MSEKVQGEKVQGVMKPGVLTGQVPIQGETPPMVRCVNTQCRVDRYTGERCPACYGKTQ